MYPFYHLWFIPAFLFWILLSCFLRKSIKNYKTLILISFLISFIAYFFKIILIVSDLGVISNVVDFFNYTLRLHFFFFFVLGFYFKKIKLSKPNFSNYLSVFLFIISTIYLFYFPNKISSCITFFLGNLLFLKLILKLSTCNLMSRNRFLEWIGNNSMGIYLWHVIPILAVQFLLNFETNVQLSNLYFYFWCLISQIIFLLSYKNLNKVDFFKKYFFGIR